MTKKDLHLLYKQETGNYVPDIGESYNFEEVKDYLEWLETKLLTLYNI